MIPTVEEVLSRLISIGADGVDPDQYEYELGVLNEAKAAWEQEQREKCKEAASWWIKWETDTALQDAILNAKGG